MAGEKHIPIEAKPLMMRHPVLMVRCTRCDATNHRFFAAKDHSPPEGPVRTITCSNCGQDFSAIKHPIDKEIDAMITASRKAPS